MLKNVFWALLALPLGSAVSLPACQAAAPAQKTLDQVKTTSISVPYEVFGLAYSRLHHNVAFAGIGNNIGVLDTSSFTPALSHLVPLPTQYLNTVDGVQGIALSDDERYVLVTAYTNYLIIVDSRKAIARDEDAFVTAIPGSVAAGNSSIEVTPFGDFAFVSEEDKSASPGDHGTVEVFKLQEAHSGWHHSWRNHTGSGNSTGYIVLGGGVVGTALSYDRKYLYITSEIVYPPISLLNISYPAGVYPGGGTYPAGVVGSYEGVVTVLDAQKLTTDPTHSRVSQYVAGCNPVRVAEAPDGKTVWVTARQSNALLAFNATKLAQNSTDALIASVQVGTAPVGLIFTKDGKRILTADSDRFSQTNVTGLTVVDVDAALKGEANAALGRIPTGLFPREFALSPDGKTILIADHDSQQIQAVDVMSMP